MPAESYQPALPETGGHIERMCEHLPVTERTLQTETDVRPGDSGLRRGRASGSMAHRHRVLVISPEPVGGAMAGPAIRAWWLARELARRHDVTLLAPGGTSEHDAPPGCRLELRPLPSYRFLATLAARFDVVVSRPLRAHLQRALARSGARVVYDMYVPSTVEQLAYYAGEPAGGDSGARLRIRRARLESLSALLYGDAIVCACQRQHDLWIGTLAGLGAISVDEYRADPSLASRVTVVPFGIDPEPPTATGAAVRGVVPGVDRDTLLLLWAGGIWNWLDPVTVIDAVAQAADELPGLHLHFLGTMHPNGDPQMAATVAALARARELKMIDKVVTFNDGWVPYRERAGALLEADIGVCAHHAGAEADFSFRTRLLDHLWAGLPTLTTRGGAVGDIMSGSGAAITLGAGDVAAWRAAIIALATDADRRGALAAGAESARQALAWPRVTEPLMALVDELPSRPQRRTPGLGGLLGSYLWTQARIQLSARGPTAVAVARGAVAAARR